MYIKIKDNQEKIIKKARIKAGGYRKLEKITRIPKASIYNYEKLEAMPENRFKIIINFLKIKIKKENLEFFENNWRQKKGGINCVKSKKKKGVFERDLKKAQKKGIQKIKEWHKKMKKEKPKEYYLIQYGKFKKICGYKYKTKKGEKVRNKFEEEVANKLYKMKLSYEYEPLVKIGKKWFFPDFLIDNKIIIEATAWEGKEKAYLLRKKMKHLNKKYKVFVIIPKHLYSKYKILKNSLIVGIDNLDLVAQWLERTAVRI